MLETKVKLYVRTLYLYLNRKNAKHQAFHLLVLIFLGFPKNRQMIDGQRTSQLCAKIMKEVEEDKEKASRGCNQKMQNE